MIAKTVALLVLIMTTLVTPPETLYMRGSWSQYAKGPTDSQIWYHTEVTGKLEDPERYDSFVAMIDCDHVGKDVWISVDGSEWRDAFVFDCSGHTSTTVWMSENNIIGELDYYTVKELGIPERQGVDGRLSFVMPVELRLDSAARRIPVFNLRR